MSVGSVSSSGEMTRGAGKREAEVQARGGGVVGGGDGDLVP